MRCLTIGVSALSFSTWRRSQGLFAIDPKAARSCKSRHKVFSSQFCYDALIAHVPKLRMPEPQSLRASEPQDTAMERKAELPVSSAGFHTCLLLPVPLPRVPDRVPHRTGATAARFFDLEGSLHQEPVTSASPLPQIHVHFARLRSHLAVPVVSSV